MRSDRRRLLAVLSTLFVLAVPAAAAHASYTYVALGDSYSSGVGTRTYISDGTSCQRSVYAYPYLIKQTRGYSFSFQACSGATTSTVQNSQLGTLDSATKYVTMTVGGNDAGFSSVITECAKPAWMSDCSGKVATAQTFIKNTLPGRLDTLYNAIRAKAPNAKVIIADYPRLFNGEDCNAGTWFSPSDESLLNQTADLMKTVISGRAAAHAFPFVDVIPPFVGHAVCDSPEWLNGLSNPTSESYHPNTTGQASGYKPSVIALM